MIHTAVKGYSRKKQGSVKLSANFLVKEFACKDGSDKILIDTELVVVLQKIRDHFNKPVTINSAYRNSSYNKKIGGASNSQHIKGTAADIVVSGIEPCDIANYAEYILGNKGGIGQYNGFVHVDVRAKRTRWTDFGKEKSVDGFFGYTPKTDEPEPSKYHIEGLTHVIEIDPRNICSVETQCSTKSVSYKNFVNGTYFMAQANGKMFPLGMLVNKGQVISNYMTHQKPVATLIIHDNYNVEMKYVSDITKEEKVWFAVSGFGIYPEITNVKEGFTGIFTDVLRSCTRPIIGYRKRDNKIVIAVRPYSTAKRAQQTAKNLGLDFAISLDAGGSTTLNVNEKKIYKGDGRKLYGGLTWC